MHDVTPNHWVFQVERHDGLDVAQLLAEALVAGLEVRHHPTIRMDDWPSIAGDPGLFRSIGGLKFSKTTRRWRVTPRLNCGPTELASLVAFGIVHARRFGDSPGHYTRKREFDHVVTKSGERLAVATCAIKLTMQDLQLEQNQAVEVPDTVHELLSLTA